MLRLKALKVLFDRVKKDEYAHEPDAIELSETLNLIEELPTLAHDTHEDKVIAIIHHDFKIDAHAGVGFDTKDTVGRTLLSHAAQNRHSEVCKKLIKLNASVNVSDHQNEAPLHYAAKNGHFDIVCQLVEAHAIVNAKNHNGQTPLMLVSFNDQAEMESKFNRISFKSVRVVHGLFASQSELFLQRLINESQLERGRIATYLVEKAHAEIEATDNQGFSALDWAIERGNLAIVNLLLAHDALIRRPKPLFDFLLACDQSDGRVLSCLTKLRNYELSLSTKDHLGSNFFKQVEAHWKYLSGLGPKPKDLPEKQKIKPSIFTPQVAKAAEEKDSIPSVKSCCVIM